VNFGYFDLPVVQVDLTVGAGLNSMSKGTTF